MEFKGTKGKWKIGKQKSTIVSNSKNIEGFQKESGHLDRSYYGGILICESIWKKEDALLISKSLEMLELLQSLVSSEMTPLAIRKQAKQLIKEATEL